MRTATWPPLIHVDSLLDAGALAGWLAPALDGFGSLLGVRPTYVRAKRATSALLGLELAWTGEAGLVRRTLASLYLAAPEVVEQAAMKARALRRVPPVVGPDLALLEDPPGLFLGFPNDRVLRGLGAAVDPRRLKNRLNVLGPPLSPHHVRVAGRASQVEAVRWKPGRRAVLCARLRLRHGDGGRSWTTLYLRVYPATELDLQIARWRAARAHLGACVPRVVLADRERCFLGTEAMEGAPRPEGAEIATGWPALEETLKVLHGTRLDERFDLPHRGDGEELFAALRTLRDLAEWMPERWVERELEPRLASMMSRLTAAPRTFIHGDLKVDQVLERSDGVALLDWDESATGDPHADLASLAVSAGASSADPDTMERFACFARRTLGALWREDRWMWHVAVAQARRGLAALQRGEPGWRDDADGALRAAHHTTESWAHPRPHARRRTPVLVAALKDLLDPDRRARLPGVGGRKLRLAAVWPDGDGAIAQLDVSSAPGPPALWLRMDDDVRAWTFPEDPGLPALSDLLAGGEWELAGHRFGRRAALRHCSGERYLHLRPEARARDALARLRVVHGAMERAGVSVPQLEEARDDLPGWLSRVMPGRPLDPGLADQSDWRAIGHSVARTHAVAGPVQWSPPPPERCIASAMRQVALVLGADPGFGALVVETADDWTTLHPAVRCAGTGREPGRTVVVHGDLHPAQIILGDRPSFLDWDHAHLGEPEEDLGNLLAHLAWELSAPGAAQAAWRALQAGYREGEGVFDRGRLAFHARLALIRVVTIHSWRDGARERARDLSEWRRIGEELPSWS